MYIHRNNQQAKSYQNVELRQKRYMQRKYSSHVKRRRKALRAVRKHRSDSHKVQEGKTYEAVNILDFRNFTREPP